MPERIYDPAFADRLAQDPPTALVGANAKSMLSEEAKPSGDQLSALSLLPRRTFMNTAGGHFGFGPVEAQEGDIIAFMLGCEVLCFFEVRPQSTSPRMYKVVGETLMEGLYDAAALLGNVLKPWRVQIVIDSSGLFTKVAYLNTETKELVTDDSRMYPLE